MSANSRGNGPGETGPPQDGGIPLGQRYLLHEVLGRGAMGQVYRATTRDAREEFAAKVLRAELCGDANLVSRFVQERTILTSVEHPNVVAVRDLVVESETLAIVMDLVRGPNLRRYLADRGTLAPATGASLTAQVLRALAAVHDRGVIHRDVKPENVLVETAGPKPVVRLTDFGIARLAHGPSLTRLTGLIGTPDYLPPELAERTHATPEADVYSAGIMLYELLCGVTPFSGGHPAAVLKAHLERLPGRIPGVPDALWEVLAAMLAKEPSSRPKARAAAETLEKMLPSLVALPALPALKEPPASLPIHVALEQETAIGRRGEGIHSKAQSAREPASGPKTNRRRLLGAIAASLVALGVVAGILLTRSQAPVSSSTRAFPEVRNGNLVVHRSWQLEGDTLTGTVRLTNDSDTPADLIHDEVIPKSVSPSRADLRRLEPEPQIIRDDPVLRFTFRQVPPHETRTVSYEATVGGSEPAEQRLALVDSPFWRHVSETILGGWSRSHHCDFLDDQPFKHLRGGGVSLELRPSMSSSRPPVDMGNRFNVDR